MVDTLEDPDPMMMQAEMDNNNYNSDTRHSERREVVKTLTNPSAEAKPLSSERSR